MDHTALRSSASNANRIRNAPAKIDQTILGRSACVRTNDEITTVVYHRTAFDPGTCRTDRIVNADTLIIDAGSASAIVRTEDTLTAIIKRRPASQPGTGRKNIIRHTAGTSIVDTNVRQNTCIATSNRRPASVVHRTALDAGTRAGIGRTRAAG